MESKQLRKKSLEDLEKMRMNSREELRNLRFDLASGKVKNVRRIRELKKEIARISTLLKEKLS